MTEEVRDIFEQETFCVPDVVRESFCPHEVCHSCELRKILFYDPQKYKTIEPKDAEIRGYSPLTTPIRVNSRWEGWLLEEISGNLKKSGIKFVFVLERGGEHDPYIAIWRKGMVLES